MQGMIFTLRTFRFLLSLFLLGACTGDTAPMQSPSPSPTMAIPTVTVSPLPSAEPTPAGPLTLSVWIPEPLAPLADPSITTYLDEQFAAFEQAQNGTVEVEWRLKRVADVGGIMSTLRSAAVVAPGAVPDLTLLRREDLVTAVQAGLLRPLEGRIASGVLGELYDSALQLGQIDGTLYGLPYLLEVQHFVYRAEPNTLYGWRYREVLEREMPLTFPARRSSGIADVFLVQYLTSGLGTGTPIPIIGTEGLVLDVEALRETLAFYEQAVAAGIISASVLDYTATSDYVDPLPEGLVLTTSTQYLAMPQDDLRFAPIPTETGRSATVLNGWLWVMPTNDADQQARAIDLLNWLLDAERQSAYSLTVGMLPSQRTPLRDWEDAEYSRFVDGLLENATLPPSESAGGVTARAIQNAFVSVLLGERTADEATQDVIEQLAQ
jgi:ABC-type glycerol-3-phosphate transport system substrate-binding protein